jgi:hypothetical protein
MKAIVLVAFVAVLAACAREPKPTTPWVGCYRFAWPDSETDRLPNTENLPDTVRLVAVRDTAAIGAESLTVRRVSSSSQWWGAIAGAWWAPYRTDSFRLTLVTNDQQWSVTFRPRGDSIQGDGNLLLGDHDLEPFDVAGRAVTCGSD